MAGREIKSFARAESQLIEIQPGLDQPGESESLNLAKLSLPAKKTRRSTTSPTPASLVFCPPEGERGENNWCERAVQPQSHHQRFGNNHHVNILRTI